MSEQNTTVDLSNVSKDLPLLDFYEQIDALRKSRLSLTLRTPKDDASPEERNALYEEQKTQILSFVNLLHDSLLTEHGKVLLCLYQLE